jgi:hypothetical protein
VVTSLITLTCVFRSHSNETACRDSVAGVEKRDHLQDLGVDGKIILKWIFKMWDGAWTELAQDRDRWRALMNAVMNVQVP